MPKIDIVLNVEQILESIRQLSEEDQRKLAASVLQDRALEPFVEEIEDNLICERRQNESAVPFEEVVSTMGMEHVTKKRSKSK